MAAEIKCSNCKFAAKFEMPTKKPDKTGYSWASTFRYALESDLYDSNMEMYLAKIKCNRFPRSEIKDKDSFCGEFKEND